MPDSRLPLEVTMSAFQWEAHKRRTTFLEAALVQALGESHRVREWFSATAIAAMRLPGMPASRNAVLAKADREGWMRRIVSGRGGERYEFHYVTLPRPAFDEIIRRVLALPAEWEEALPHAAAVPPIARIATTGAIAPQWLLPLMRVVKAGARDPEAVMRELPALLPPGVPEPTIAEVIAALRAYGGKPG